MGFLIYKPVLPGRSFNYAFGSIDTKDLLFAFFLKTTLPSTKA